MRRRFGRHFFGRRFGRHFFERGKQRHCLRVCGSLADVLPGCRACVRGFGPGLPPNRQDHLMAYGVIPGNWVEVIQHSPVTVVQVENTELALEDELASQIEVDGE